MTVINFDKQVVKAAARGRWAEIFQALAPELQHAQAHPGKHGPCPVHGETDGFRLFPDYQERGNGICNTCGAQSDGFQMLMWLHQWTFPQTIEKVGEFLGLKPVPHSTFQKGAASADSPKAEVFEGVMTFIGKQSLRRSNGKPATVFAIKLVDSKGRSHTCLGADLQRALKVAHAVKGQEVRVTRLGLQEILLPNGSKVMKTMWDVERLHPLKPTKSGQQTSVSSLKADKRYQAIVHLWRAGKPISRAKEGQGTALERYLTFRGIDPRKLPDGLADSLRFIPSAFYHNESTGMTESYPAMLCAVRDIAGHLVTVHRTFLTEEGRKASIATPKRLMALPDGATINGAAIRLGDPDDVLCLAEGVETALSVMLGTGYPCWATVSAIGMTEVQIPQGVRTVFIFADKDRTQTGAKAAETLRARLADEGRLAVTIEIADDIPEGSKGLDWNDILQTRGCGAFPLRKPTV